MYYRAWNYSLTSDIFQPNWLNVWAIWLLVGQNVRTIFDNSKHHICYCLNKLHEVWPKSFLFRHYVLAYFWTNFRHCITITVVYFFNPSLISGSSSNGSDWGVISPPPPPNTSTNRLASLGAGCDTGAKLFTTITTQHVISQRNNCKSSSSTFRRNICNFWMNYIAHVSFANSNLQN